MSPSATQPAACGAHRRPHLDCPHAGQPGQSGSFAAGQGAAVSLDGRYDAVIDGQALVCLNLGGYVLGLNGGSRGGAVHAAGSWQVRRARAGGPVGESLAAASGRCEVFGAVSPAAALCSMLDRAADIRQTIALPRNALVSSAAISGGIEDGWSYRILALKQTCPCCSTPCRTCRKISSNIGARLDNAALLQHAGVRIAFTRSATVINARKVRQPRGNAVAHGLSGRGLAALTINPATIFGQGGQRGQIAGGQTADLVLWSGDPLEADLTCRSGLIAGTAIPMRSRQTELRDRYLERLKSPSAR